MDKILNEQSLRKVASDALHEALQHICNNRLVSVWNKKVCGWQEMWNKSKFAGLYATADALMLLAKYYDKYQGIVDDAVEELTFVYDDRIDYTKNPDDTKEEALRKERCRYLLKQNYNTTLKAVYFLRTVEKLEALNINVSNEKGFEEIRERVYQFVESTYCDINGSFFPAKNNYTDFSILTTMYSYLLMINRWGKTSEKLMKTKDSFVNYLSEYNKVVNSTKEIDKFERYLLKRNVVVSMYSLSHSMDLLNDNELEMLVDTFSNTMKDEEIREGFKIIDSYTIPETTSSWDSYVNDSRMLYLDTVLTLIMNDKLPLSILEYFLDDIEDIIDTTVKQKEYVNWDKSPSFSQNLRGLNIIQLLIECLDKMNVSFSAMKISPVSSVTNKHLSIDSKSVVLFMSFSQDYTDSLYESIQEVLEYMGLNLWCARNDAYDVSVMDSIWHRLNTAQIVIVDCTERSANVMYEAGLAHGLGKNVLLCGPCKDVFPYECDDQYNVCYYVSDGEINPPPYRDLQAGIIKYIIENIDLFCFTPQMKEKVLSKAREFAEEKLSEVELCM